jgi:hypothetical protein
LKWRSEFGAHAPHADVAILLIDDLALALVEDVRELQLLAEDLRELVERDLGLERVLALVLAGLALAVAVLALFAADRIALVTLALTHAAALLVGVAEARDVDLRDGDGHDVLPLRPISSPCEMYFLRFCRILPRTICLKRP